MGRTCASVALVCLLVHLSLKKQVLNKSFGAQVGDPLGKMLYAYFLQNVIILVNDGSPASFKSSSRVALSFFFSCLDFLGEVFLDPLYLYIYHFWSGFIRFWRSLLLIGILNELQRHLTMMDIRPFFTQVLMHCGEFTEDIHLS